MIVRSIVRHAHDGPWTDNLQDRFQGAQDWLGGYFYLSKWVDSRPKEGGICSSALLKACRPDLFMYTVGLMKARYLVASEEVFVGMAVDDFKSHWLNLSSEIVQVNIEGLGTVVGFVPDLCHQLTATDG